MTYIDVIRRMNSGAPRESRAGSDVRPFANFGSARPALAQLIVHRAMITTDR